MKYDLENIRSADLPVVKGKRLSSEEVRTLVRDYIESYFYGNDNYFAVSCMATYCAFYGLHVPAIQFALG